jgi:hypothetical protein
VLSPPSASQVGALLRNCFSSLRGARAHSAPAVPARSDSGCSSSTVAGSSIGDDASCTVQLRQHDTAAAPAADSCKQAHAPAASRRRPSARHCLVFSYANDLHWCYTL